MNTKGKHRLFAVMLFAATSFNAFAQQEDWADFKHYAEKNIQLKETIQQTGQKPVAVFMGNSITEGWGNTHPQFFSDNGYVCRGITGQTTYQMLLRFYEDVIALQPQVAVILGGTNDVAENNHEFVVERTLRNIQTMTEQAQLHGIAVVLCSVLPSSQFWWRKELTGIQQRISMLNDSIAAYARENNIPYVDYCTPMVYGDDRSLNPSYADDGVHPNAAGYDVMEPLVRKAIEEALRRQ